MCYLCVGFRKGNAQRPEVEQGNAPAQGMAENLKVMKNFVLDYWLFAVLVLAVVAYCYALIVGGLIAFGGASVAFVAVVGVAFWVDNLLDKYL